MPNPARLSRPFHPPLAAPVRGLALAAVLMVAAGSASAVDVRVAIDTRNSTTNPGPFTNGSGTTFSLDFRIDGSVAPVGATPTWQAALDDLVLEIHDATLGQFTITGQDGRWQQLSTSGDFLFGGWGGVNGGSLSALSVLNPALSDTPFVLTDISFDLRGPDLLADETTLPGTLSMADFSYLSLVLRFGNDDPGVGVVPKSSIIRTAVFDTVSVSPVPEPAPAALLLAGLAALGLRRRGRCGVDRAAVPASTV